MEHPCSHVKGYNKEKKVQFWEPRLLTAAASASYMMELFTTLGDIANPQLSQHTWRTQEKKNPTNVQKQAVSSVLLKEDL